MVPLKELQEAGLGPSGPLNPSETEIIVGSLEVPHVHGQVLQPQTSPLPNCGQLGRPAGRAGTISSLGDGAQSKLIKTHGNIANRMHVMREPSEMYSCIQTHW